MTRLLPSLVQTIGRPVGDGERKRARAHLLDWVACVAGARASPVARVAAALHSPVERAALLGNVLEMDDVHRTARLHPGPVVWPTALGMGEAGLDAVLDAGVRGYQAMIDIGTRLDAHHYAHWHPTSTAGLPGAAATAGSLLGLPAEAMVWALANAVSVAGGLWHMRHDDVMTKQWHVLHAVQAGTQAARLAAAGMTGPAAILEGPQGLFAAMNAAPGAINDPPDPATAAREWLIETVSFKPWAACRHAHPAIDCALDLRGAGRLAAPFEVATYADALAFCDRPQPQTEIEAKFSLQHAVAVVAAGRDVGPADFTPAAIAELAGLRAQVRVVADPAITARYPAHFGARLNGHALDDTRGDPERPLAEADLVAKLHSLVAWGGLPAREADRAARLVLEGDDAAAIVAMLGDWLA
jgi:2-methylcitrate dehydratase PrpD